MRFFGAADRVAYTSWLLGVKEESEGPEPLESSSVTRCHARAQGSGLNSKMAVSREFATCRDFAATQLGRRSGRRPDFGAAQYPRIERRAISASLRAPDFILAIPVAFADLLQQRKKRPSRSRQPVNPSVLVQAAASNSNLRWL